MPNNPSAELRDYLSELFDRYNVAAQDAKGLELESQELHYEDFLHAEAQKLDEFVQLHTAAQVAASQTQMVDVIEEIFKLVGPSDISKVLNAARKGIGAHLTPGQKEQG
jgi:hypothetical protein